MTSDHFADDILQFSARESQRFARDLAWAHIAGAGPGADSEAMKAARRAVQRLRDIGWCT